SRPPPAADSAGEAPEPRDILFRPGPEGRVLTKDLLSIADLDAPSLRRLLELAAEFKARRGRIPPDTRLAGKTLALVFQKPSLRTRVSFEVAMSELGGRSMYLSPQEI